MRATVLILLAIVLFMAGLSVSATCVKGIRENEIVSMGRRTTSRIRKEQAPWNFWFTLSFNGLTAVGFFGGSVASVVSAIRGGKEGPTRR